MTERSRPWDGTTTGHATEAPYDAPTEFARILMAVSATAGMANKGAAISDVGSELAVTGSATPVSIAAGEALVYGTWYENDGATTKAISTPAASTRIDRIVLRKAWAAQTVTITVITGVEGGAAPALVQVAGTTWDFPLAQVSITTGGVITVTDDREFLASGGDTFLTSQVFS